MAILIPTIFIGALVLMAPAHLMDWASSIPDQASRSCRADDEGEYLKYRQQVEEAEWRLQRLAQELCGPNSGLRRVSDTKGECLNKRGRASGRFVTIY